MPPPPPPRRDLQNAVAGNCLSRCCCYAYYNSSSIRLHWRPALLLTQAAAEPATAVARPLSMGPNGFPSSQIIFAFNFESNTVSTTLWESAWRLLYDVAGRVRRIIWTHVSILPKSLEKGVVLLPVDLQKAFPAAHAACCSALLLLCLPAA